MSLALTPETAECRRVHLPLLSNSSLTTFRRCPREYQFRYVMMRKPRRKSDALRFGSLFHVGLNAWWLTSDVPPSARLYVAVEAVRRASEKDDTDPFDLVKAECLLVGYTARWGDERYTTIAVEKQFRLPIENVGPTNVMADLGGAIDAIAQDEAAHCETLATHLVEHKTTSSDISAGSDYWRHVVALDPQVSTYMSAAKALGYDPRDTIYDVVRKPTLLPLKATPEDARRYTKPTKAEPIPRLYSNQREYDETPEEYRERLMADIASRPDWYFQRKTIVRLERDHAEHARDVMHTAEMIRFAEERDAWPRSPNACERYGRLCEYHPVCSGETNIEDDTRYATKTKQHEELDP